MGDIQHRVAASQPNAQTHSPIPRPSSRKLNVGVVGIGRMGQRHALNLLQLVPRATLVCACSPADADIEWAEEQLVPFGVTIFRTFNEMIDFPGLQAVIIASATSLHYEHTLVCLDRGIHVVCEKPVAGSLTELEHLIEKAENTPRTKAMVGFTRRFDENYREALATIRAGAIGKPVIIRSQGCEKFDNSPFMHNYVVSCGGIFFDSVVHDIDLALSFFGNESKPKSAYAVGTAARFKQLEATKDADNAVGVCQFWGGQIAYFYNSRTAAAGYDNQTEIFGESGKISINLVSRRNRVEVSDDAGVHVASLASWADRYAPSFVTEAIEFVDSVLDDKPVPIPLRPSLTSLKIALALQESLESGRPIYFDNQGNQSACRQPKL